MQTDMHYYGTYAMARAAGLSREASGKIATASEFVDDNIEKDSVEFRDGGRVDSAATAHHAINIKNIDREDQRQIWVPFHFLPGNEGDSFTAKLVCRKNSEIAQRMIEFNTSLINQPYAIQLIGITAHVFADTFSHYGFSGISSRKNKIVNDSIEFKEVHPDMDRYLRDKEKIFKENYPKEEGLLTNIKSWFADTFSGALGHGAVVTFPDRPFLKWSFKYEETKQRCALRDNPATYLEACEGLHSIFAKVAKERTDLRKDDSFRTFESIKDVVNDILNTQADKQGRIDAWQAAATNGNLFNTGAEDIPVYNKHKWHIERDNLTREKDSATAVGSNIYHFYQAASIHRLHVLRNLLPSYNLVVA